MKRVLSFLLCLCMVLSLVPLMARADEAESEQKIEDTAAGVVSRGTADAAISTASSTYYEAVNAPKYGYMKIQDDTALVLEFATTVDNFKSIEPHQIKFADDYSDLGEIPAEYYTLAESKNGMTITISAEYLNQLEKCRYSIYVNFEDGHGYAYCIKGKKYELVCEGPQYHVEDMWFSLEYSRIYNVLLGSTDPVELEFDAPNGAVCAIYDEYDGLLSPDCYTVTSKGSTTIVTLTSEYVATFSDWIYSSTLLYVEFADGFAWVPVDIDCQYPYHVLNKENGYISLDSDGRLTIETDIPYYLFANTYVDGEKITNGRDYIALDSEDGTVIKVFPEYLNTLDIGGYHWCDIGYYFQSDDFNDGELWYDENISVEFGVGTEYVVVEGNNQVTPCNYDGELTFKIDAPFEKFLGLGYNDVSISDDYEVTAYGDCTLITLKKEAWDRMYDFPDLGSSVGAIFTDGYAKLNFYVMFEDAEEALETSDHVFVQKSRKAMNVHIDAPVEELYKVYIDDEVVPTVYYTLTGDTTISVLPRYLELLDAGTHIFYAEFDNTCSYVVFEVTKHEKCEDSDGDHYCDVCEAYCPDRISGKNRYITAVSIADQIQELKGTEKFDSIIIAAGDNFADALAGSYLANAKDAPILLSYGQGGNYAYLDSDNIAYIKENLAEGGTVYILGGTKAVPASYETELAGYNVKRLSGRNRFNTNLEILKEADIPEGSEILVCTGYNYADSLSASATGKPILLVHNQDGTLYGVDEEFLSSLKNCTFTIIGGTGAVGNEFVEILEQYGTVRRLSGKTRYETSVLVAETYFEEPTSAVVAYAWNYPDGLCGGVLAYSLDAPLLLTKDGDEAAAAAYTARNGITSGIVLGGEKVISNATVENILGRK